MKTTDVENFPGFPEGIMGPDLMMKMQEQAERFGTEILYDDVTALELDGDVKRVTVGNGDVHEALTVIYATGSAYRKLGLDDETRLSGYGVSWCATCDGWSSYIRISSWMTPRSRSISAEGNVARSNMSLSTSTTSGRCVALARA